ncbi:uracil-DNA glycosylase [Paraburkholderia sp. Ac-20336]|uniref:uracil-DNA glycosylase family protein n=1 Tax=Paraburkholderia sp. Ac-20336 TaxID=2703886 RepID=UPI001982099E|nr:uracil-DNA glycosylase family protein [Paraburkholderia sp. Ac-20336]MBN3803529.1 uracil-DNA glycosylase [Paraburkholderia sp. Ac-20336]
MALHESVLEEFGLAPLWVRRGMAARQPAGEAAVGLGDAGGAHAPRDEGGESVHARAREQDVPAGQTQAQAQGERRAPEERDEAMLAEDPRHRSDDRAARERADELQSMQGDVRDERRAEPASRTMPEAMHASADRGEPSPARREPAQQDTTAARREPAQQDEAAAHREPAQSRACQQEQQRAQPPAYSPAPPNFDAPPDDDFAWFDDLPAHSRASESAHEPVEARGNAPALPAVHTLDWDALSERVAACESCRLCEKRTNTVFGVGDRNAEWMLVGEAPGENEDRLGEPFVGQAGKLLDNMLRSLALARGTNVYIANVIKCRPPGNRNPQPDEVARCEPYLQRQVALVKPKLIVALGRFAAQSLLKTEASISSLRGRVHRYEGVPVIVSYHPAYLLRSLPDKAKAWADLCLARDTWLAGGGAPSNEPK